MRNKKPTMKTKKPKEVYRKIMDTKICDIEHRKVLFEYLKMSMKEHYCTIFGEFPNDKIEFVFDEDATLLMKVYADNDDYEAPNTFEVWKIMARIPLDDKDEWCFETFIEAMN